MGFISKILKKKLSDRYIYLLQMIRSKWLVFIIAIFCMMIISGSTAAIAFLIKNILDDIFIAKDAFMLKLIPVAVILIALGRGLAVLGKEYLMNHIGQGIVMQLRNRLYSNIQDLSLSFFHKEKTGVLMSRVTNDVNLIKTMVSSAVTGVIEHIFTIIGLTAVVFYRDWKLAIIAFLVIPVAFYPIVHLARKIRKVSTGTQEAFAEMSSFLHETFSGNKIVKAFCREDYEKQRFYKKSKDLYKYEMKKVKAQALSSPVMEICGGLGIAFVVWYGGHGVIRGTSTTGTFFSFLTAVFLLYEPFKKLTKLNNSVQVGLAALDRVFDVIEIESEIQDPLFPIDLADGSHEITFKNVSFSYETDPVLRNINIKARAGEIIALVGMSGGGKSTLVNLIPRFYDIQQGEILIDDVNIKSLSINALRQQIAIVTQEAILFNDTIRSNIAYGNPNANETDIINAAKAAYADDYIYRLPQGFDTYIGELGGRLSGGERQRLCIARALLKDAPVLLLDEATSALDAEAEKVVQKALENLMKGRTTFVIAHRLSTIMHADRILVIVDGQIVEQGSHHELLDKGREYRRLYDMQFSDQIRPQNT